MATKAKEGTQLKSKSTSALATPSASSQWKRLGPTGTGTPDKDATASTQEKPIPNYLRPTVSSGQNSKHQHSESPSKSPITKKPVEKSASPLPQSKDKVRSHKSPLPKPTNSPKSTSEKAKASSYKNVKTAKAPTTSASSKSSISKGTGSAGAKTRGETKAPTQVAEVFSVESHPQGEELKTENSPICDNAEKNEEESDGNEKQEKILQHAASEESETAGADDTGKEAVLADSSNEEGEGRKVEVANVALKNEEAKEKGLPTAYNAVKGETASKLAAEKRNKVRALVGAFETVMELEGQRSPQKGGKGKNVGENQLMEEKKADTSQESRRIDEDKKAQGGVEDDQEQEEKNNVEIEHDIEGEQEGGKSEEGFHSENVEEVTESADEEGSRNTAKESSEDSRNDNGNGNGNGIGEVMGSEEDGRKDASP